jgi:hypothetical protein
MANVIKETRQVGEFDRIEVRGVGKIFIAQGQTPEVIVEADEQIIKRITTDVVDGKLSIDVGRDWVERLSAGLEFLTSREIIFHITLKNLKSLDVLGACDLEATGLNTNDLDVRISGAGQLKLLDLHATRLDVTMPGAGKVVVSGGSEEQEISLTGAGNYDAPKFKSKNTKVSLTGVGSATVWATENLDVTVTGVGNIEYYGNPHIKQSTTMLGTVRNVGEEPKL